MKRRNGWLLALLACLALLALTPVAVKALASMALERWVFSGGEAPRVSGALLLDATIGQPVAALSSNGALTLYWGYWGPGNYFVYLPLLLRQN